MSRFNGKRAEFEASGEKINVAILGAGRIAHTMANTLVEMATDPLYSSWIHPYAVAARDLDRAQAFANQWHLWPYPRKQDCCARKRFGRVTCQVVNSSMRSLPPEKSAR